MTFKLELDFIQWREWAFSNGIHEYVIAFLTAHPEELYKKLNTKEVVPEKEATGR